MSNLTTGSGWETYWSNCTNPNLEFITTCENVSFMSLFKIREEGASQSRWTAGAGTWHNGNTVVSCDGRSLTVACGTDGWEVTL